MLKNGVNFLIFSHIWISIGAVGLFFGNCRLLNIEFDIYYLLLIFFATFGYSIQYSGLFEINKSRPLQSAWVNKNSSVILFLKWISFSISLLLSIKIFDFQQIILSLPFFLAVLFYKKKISVFKDLRTFPLIKIFVIAACWSWVCSVLPQLTKQNFSLDWFNVIFTFIFILAITIPFDVRDLVGDSKSILTIPILVGKNKAIILSLVLLISLVIPLLMQQNFGIVLYFVLVFLVLIPSFYTSSEYYYLFIVDGVLVVFPIFATW